MSHNHYLKYTRELAAAIKALDHRPILAAADLLFEAWKNKRSVYIFGNGGSWSTAEHFACDLRKWSRVRGSGGVRAQALTLTPLATAYANDHAYDEIFSRQLNDLMQEDDVAIGISCSGESENVGNALDFAGRFGKRILLTGRPLVIGGTVIHPRDVLTIYVGADDIRVQEDTHLAVCHIIAGEVKERIAQFASSRKPHAVSVS